MQTIRPNYYHRFICRAGECSFTCCQEWKIAVDDTTAKKWKHIPVPETLQAKRKKLNYFTTFKDGDRVIALNENHECPFLNQKKLCELVIQYGDEMLSKTCQIFPREIHDFKDRREYTLMPSCPAVVDLLKEEETFVLIKEQGEGVELKAAEEKKTESEQEEVLWKIRELLISIMKRKDISPNQALLMIFYLALDMLEKEEREELTVESLAEYEKSGLLKDLQKTIEKMEFDAAASFEERNELFLDLVENYRREGMYQEYLEDIAKRAEAYLSGMESYDEVISQIEEKLEEFSGEWKKYENLFCNLLCEEIFAESLAEGEGMEHMVVKLQWLAMEYAVIQQCLFLKWDRTGTLAYEDVRDSIVILFRMTGYGEEDIHTYLEQSFESLVWEWGYFALIVGGEK